MGHMYSFSSHLKTIKEILSNLVKQVNESVVTMVKKDVRRDFVMALEGRKNLEEAPHSR